MTAAGDKDAGELRYRSPDRFAMNNGDALTSALLAEGLLRKDGQARTTNSVLRKDTPAHRKWFVAPSQTSWIYLAPLLPMWPAAVSLWMSISTSILL